MITLFLLACVAIYRASQCMEGYAMTTVKEDLV